MVVTLPNLDLYRPLEAESWRECSSWTGSRVRSSMRSVLAATSDCFEVLRTKRIRITTRKQLEAQSQTTKQDE